MRGGRAWARAEYEEGEGEGGEKREWFKCCGAQNSWNQFNRSDWLLRPVRPVRPKLTGKILGLVICRVSWTNGHGELNYPGLTPVCYTMLTWLHMGAYFCPILTCLGGLKLMLVSISTTVRLSTSLIQLSDILTTHFFHQTSKGRWLDSYLVCASNIRGVRSLIDLNSGISCAWTKQYDHLDGVMLAMLHISSFCFHMCSISHWHSQQRNKLRVGSVECSSREMF